MPITADLARDVARALLDFADRMDAADDPASLTGELPPIPEGATGQRRVVEVLTGAPDRGLSARAIAEYTAIAQMNVYEKLDRLMTMGYVEEVAGSSPKRWRLTQRGMRVGAGVEATGVR